MSLIAGGITVAGVATAGAIISGAAAVGSMFAGALGAQTEEEAQEQREAAQDLFQERAGRASQLQRKQRGLLRSQQAQTYTTATEQAALGAEVSQSQFAGGQRDVSMGTQAGMRGIQEFGDTAASRSGLATSGTIEKQTKIQTGDLMAKYKSDMTKLLDTRTLAAKERNLSVSTAKAEADLAFRSGELSSQEAYQSTIDRAADVYESTLTDIESQPTGIWEGMFS